MNRLALSLLLILCATHQLHSAIVVRGNDTVSPFAFKTAVNATTYDRRSGMFYVGLASGTDAYTISKANRPTFKTIAQFNSVLSSSSDPLDLINSTIEFLSFSPQTNTKQILTGVQENTTPLAAQKVFALFTDGSSEVETSELYDASGAAATDGIVNMISNASNIFAAIKPNGSFWGDTDSGIALVGINADNSAVTLTVKNAPTGADGNVAVRLDKSSTALLGTTGFTITATVTPMVWDDEMARLFVGLHIETGTLTTDVAKGAVVGRISSGALALQTITPNTNASPIDDQIVITQGALRGIQANHIGVLHASTGPDYLIVDCNISTTACNRVFALPLVNDITDPTDSLNGTLANKDSALDSNNKFTIPATSATQLVINDVITSPQAVVGAGDLPIAADDTISDLVIIDDAVYISIDDNNGASLSDSDRGVFYSQAMFDDAGKIIRWTPWTQRVVPFNAFPSTTLPNGSSHNGGISFLEVDGKTGNVWIVESTTKKTVGITAWGNGETTNGLITTLKSKFSNGIYSVLDLDQATRGFFQTTVQRYALFGGVNKVGFARISQAVDASRGGSDQSYSSSPQTVITDFSSDENFLVTTIDENENGGCCQVLEYSRTSTVADENTSNSNLNYFFAGTEKGLYVFSDGGNGFDAADLALLDASPFDGSWQKIETIKGNIIDIKTSGSNGTAANGTGTLYVIANTTSSTAPLKSILYSIPFTSTVATMFASSNIRTLAETGVGTLNKTLQFYGIQIVATGDPFTTGADDKEQLVLTTNQGLFISRAAQGAGIDGTITAANQTAANWTLLEDTANNLTTETIMYNGIAGQNTPIRHTTWPFNLKDKANFGIFDRGNINQLSSASNTFNDFFVPLNFNADSTANAFKTLDRIIHFFSDGGRRLFIFNRTQDPPTEVKIGVLPFDVSVWNITQPDILADPTLAAIRRFYWTRTIGSSGILLAGTESGAVGLE